MGGRRWAPWALGAGILVLAVASAVRSGPLTQFVDFTPTVTVFLPLVRGESEATATPIPPTSTATATVTATATATATATTPAAVCSCAGNLYNCTDFATQAEAQACFDYCWDLGYGDVHNLDADGDLEACESLP